MNKKILYHLGINIDEYKLKHNAKFALLPGAPERVTEIGNYLHNVKDLAYNREFKSIIGVTDNGTEVIVCSTGIGGPSAAIAVEELYMLGVRNFIRIGTCGGINSRVKSGDVVIATSAVRQEGTSMQYAPIEFPATADFLITSVLYQTSQKICLSNKIHIGVVQCKDSFYGQHNPERMAVSQELLDKWDSWRRLGVLASEMESSTIFCVAANLGCKAGAIFSVVWNQELGRETEIHDNDIAIKIAVNTVNEMGGMNND